MNRFAVTVQHVIRAPRAPVYQAFLEPELVAQWLAPSGSVVSTATVDEQVGGVHRVDMIDEHGEATCSTASSRNSCRTSASSCSSSSPGTRRRRCGP